MPDGVEEYMIHRVMQRVDVVLDQRLREAIATVVQEQTRSVLPRLREEIESVVRHAVYEAVADERHRVKVTWRNGNRVIPCGFALHLIVFPNELACKLRYVSLR
jgi:hypothetical protein